MTEQHAAALDYAALGWPVLPLHSAVDGRCTCGRSDCPSPAKHPRTVHGLKEASADLERVNEWWGRWPAANVGLLTGHAFDVLDLDGEAGMAAFRDACDLHGTDLPSGPRSRTGGGGRHVLFLPTGCGNRAGILGKVDWRGAGGYIVAPPSVHVSGVSYAWLSDPEGEVPAPPWWLLDLVDPPKAPPRAAVVRPLPAGAGDGTPYGLQALEAELAELARAQEGERNATLNQSAFSLYQLVAGGELRETAVEQRLRATALGIGLVDSEIDKTMASAAGAGKSQPRTAPDLTVVEGSLARARTSSPTSSDGKKLHQATELVRIVEENYELCRSTTGEPIAVPIAGAHIARPLRGGRDSLRAELAATYAARRGKIPSQSSLSDAMQVIEGKAQRGRVVEVHLRVARDGDRVVIDLGDEEGSTVVVDAGGWSVHDRSPVLFRRTELTSELPMPERGGELEELRSLMNISAASWPMAVGWLVACLLEGMPHPIALLTGEQGSGKTTAGRILAELVDPSPSPLRTCPRDEEAWAIAAAGSWVVGIDNVSTIAPWLSDALCRAVTGDGLVRRRLYTDDQLTVLAIRRVVILTSIDTGAMRGDLADRLLPIELEPIPETGRREDGELEERFQAVRPRVLGALLDLAAKVVEVLPTVRPDRLPRMADFGRLLAAVDAVMGTDAFESYRTIGERVLADVVDADPVAAAVRRLVERLDDGEGRWEGTAAALLDELTPDHKPRSWPADATRLAGRLKRAAPALRSIGIEIETRRSGSRRLVRIEGGASLQGVGASLASSPASLFDDSDAAGQATRRVAGDASDADPPTPPRTYFSEDEGGGERKETNRGPASLATRDAASRLRDAFPGAEELDP